MALTKEIKGRCFYLYILKDPYDLRIKYVGITSVLNPVKSNCRIRQHVKNISKTENYALRQWKSKLKLGGTNPIFEVIKKFDNYDSARKMESILIKKMKSELLNANA